MFLARKALRPGISRRISNSGSRPGALRTGLHGGWPGDCVRVWSAHEDQRCRRWFHKTPAVLPKGIAPLHSYRYEAFRRVGRPKTHVYCRGYAAYPFLYRQRLHRFCRQNPALRCFREGCSACRVVDAQVSPAFASIVGRPHNAGRVVPIRLDASGTLPGRISGHFPGLDERLHTHEVLVHPTFRIGPEERCHHVAERPRSRVIG